MATDNAKYVRRGRGLAVAHDPGWEEDLMEANCSKEGAPFRYADGLIMAAAALRIALGMQYRQLSGFLAAMLEGRDSPHYSVLCRRINRLDVDIDGGLVRVSDRSAPMTLLADSSGLKQCNRGEWIRQKWRVRRGVRQDTPAGRRRHQEDTCSDGDRRQGGRLPGAGGSAGNRGGAEGP